MTAIVGIEHRGDVWIGADAAAVAESDLQVRRQPKVFRNGPFLIGCSGSFRLGQLVRHAFRPPPHRRGDVETYLVTEFALALQESLHRHGYAPKCDDSVALGGSMLVGYRGRLYAVETDLQVARWQAGFAAIGSGAAYAIGALSVTGRLAPAARLRAALAAAAQFCADVTKPFAVRRLRGPA
jgi:ATP-dependent protease HslVU (ClpYQ) peptidase subunit